MSGSNATPTDARVPEHSIDAVLNELSGSAAPTPISTALQAEDGHESDVDTPVEQEPVSNSSQPIRNFFRRMWNIIRNSRIQLANLGHTSITNAQTVLRAMRDDLKQTWHFDKEMYNNPTRLLITFLAKIGYSALTLIVSSASSVVQLAFGSVCLTLSFEFVSLGRRLLNTLSAIVNQGWEVLKGWVSGAWKAFCNVASRVSAAIIELGAKFIAACRNKLVWLVTKLSEGLELAWEGIKFLGRKLSEGLELAWEGIKFIARKLVDGLNAFLDGLQIAIRHIGRAVLNLANGVGQLLWGVTKAAYSIIKGSVIAVAALFIETGADNLVRGPAKAVMILDIAVAAAVGSLLDGLYSFTKAIGLTGRNRVAARHIENENDNDDDLLAGDGLVPTTRSPITTGLEPKEDTWYYNKTLKNGADRFNRNLLWLGDKLYKAYTDQKCKLLGRNFHGYEVQDETRYGAEDLLHPSSADHPERRSVRDWVV